MLSLIHWGRNRPRYRSITHSTVSTITYCCIMDYCRRRLIAHQRLRRIIYTTASLTATKRRWICRNFGGDMYGLDQANVISD